MDAWQTLLNPIVIMAMTLVGSMVLLIGAAVLGIDKGVLRNMSNMDYARGLITYLFAVMTIGTAVVIVLSALVPFGTDTAQAKEHFDRGKEILSLLLGVFGTIVGYYFGASVGSTASTLHLAPLRVAPNVANLGAPITIQTVATGGVPPYLAGIGFGNDRVKPQDRVPDDGWIIREMTTREFQSGEPSIVRVVLQDATGKRTDTTAPITVNRPTGASESPV